MTNERAIELLCAYGTPLDEDKFQEALNMAITALSAEYKYGWCKGCKEYDTEKHCCHRWSSFIRYTLQDSIDYVLDDIKDEIKHLHEWAFSREEILKIIDKHISGKDKE